MGKLGIKQRPYEGEKAKRLGISRMTLGRYRRKVRKMPPEMRRKLKEIDKQFRAGRKE